MKNYFKNVLLTSCLITSMALISNASAQSYNYASGQISMLNPGSSVTFNYPKGATVTNGVANGMTNGQSISGNCAIIGPAGSVVNITYANLSNTSTSSVTIPSSLYATVNLKGNVNFPATTKSVPFVCPYLCQMYTPGSNPPACSGLQQDSIGPDKCTHTLAERTGPSQTETVLTPSVPFVTITSNAQIAVQCQ